MPYKRTPAPYSLWCFSIHCSELECLIYQFVHLPLNKGKHAVAAEVFGYQQIFHNEMASPASAICATIFFAM